MELQINQQHRDRVEEFRQKHRTALVTLLFTDLVGSTKMKQELGDSRGVALVQSYHALVRAFLDHFPEGEEVSTAGDSFFIVFVKPSDAVRFSLLLQSGLRGLSKDSPFPLLNRIGVHIGEVVVEEGDGTGAPRDLLGMQVDTCARIMSLATGDQTLMSRSVFDNARQVLKGQELEGVGDISWLNHGTYVVKGVEDPLEVCEVGETGLSVLEAPADSAKARRHVSPDEEPVLGWRPALEQVVPGTEWVLEEKLGEGGFGEVWKARHRKLKECRVFKFCFRADRVRSLRREVTLFRVLKEHVGEHPNIIRLYDVYFDEPPFYIVEEYVEGRDLVSWCERYGGVDQILFETRLEIVAQAADALQAAHDAGVIHRDVKPSNILISGGSTSSNGVQVKLTDFGIGQVVSKEALAGVTEAGFTQTLLVSDSSSRSGTHLYMAPELIVGKPATVRSDIYSLGVVLYQLLIGELSRPLATDWTKEIGDALICEDLSRCFAGNPEERFANAGQLTENLRNLYTRRATLAAREAAKRRAAKRHKLSVALASISGILLLLAVALAYGLRQAELARQTAVGARYDAEREQYFTSIRFAAMCIEDLRFDRAHELLQACPSQHRNWEWGRCLLLCNRDMLTLRGHSAEVHSVAFSPDGTRIATASHDGTAKIWDSEVASTREILTLQGHDSGINSVVFSPDGERVATGSQDGTATIWDAATAEELLVLTGHSEDVYSVAFSSDGNRFITGSRDHTAKVWDTSTGHEILTLRGHVLAINAVAFSPNSKRVITGSFDKTAKVWNAETGNELLRLEGHSDSIYSVAFSPDGHRIVTGSRDNSLRVWDAKTGSEVLSLEGHSGSVYSVAFSPDGKSVATGSEDNTAKVWDVQTGQNLLVLEGHSRGVYSVAFNPDGSRIISGSGDNTAKVWDSETDHQVFTLEGYNYDDVDTVNYSSDGKLEMRDEDASGSEVLSLEGRPDGINCAAFSRDGKYIATGSGDTTAKVWDRDTGHELLSLEGHLGTVWTIDFSLDGKRIITGSEDNTVKLWDSETGREIFSLESRSSGIRAVKFDRSTRVRVETHDGTTKMWEAFPWKEEDYPYDLSGLDFIKQVELCKRDHWLQRLAVNEGENLESLVAALKDEDPDSRGFAASRLGALGDPLAIEPLLKALEDPNRKVRGFAGKALGDIYAATGRADEALQTYENAAALIPLDSDLRIKLANIYDGKGMIEKALVQYDALEARARAQLEANPGSPRLANNLAWHYVEKGIRKKEAILLAEKAVELETHFNLLDTLGWTYLRDEQYGKALRTFAEVFSINPGFDSSWRGVAEIAQSSVRSEVFLQFCREMNERTDIDVAVDELVEQFLRRRGEEDETAEQWPKTDLTSAAMPESRHGFAFGVIRNKFYVAGGFELNWENDAARGQLWAYDLISDTWDSSPLPQLPERRGAPASGVIDETLYVAGGARPSDVATATLYAYMPGASWERKADMPHATSRASATVLKRKFYVFGGISSAASNLVGNWVQIYDTVTDTWSLGRPLPVGIRHPAAATCNGKIYVIGGRVVKSDLNLNQIYDPATDDWTQGARAPLNVSGGALITVDNELWYIGGNIGGSTGTTSNSNILIYSPETDSWAYGPSLTQTLRNGCGVGRFADSICIFGGQGYLWIPEFVSCKVLTTNHD